MSKSSNALAENTKDVSDDVKAFGRDVLKLANSIGDEAKTRVDDLSDGAQGQARVAYANVRSQVSANPAIALGMAAGAGVLVGLLLRGRR
jgi:ElaB/YqjD/DUF883 family membrane-anchored ribosome-binding protein